MKRESDAIEVYKKMNGKEELSGHLARVLEINRTLPKKEGLDSKGWENFVSAAEQMSRMLIKSEKNLEKSVHIDEFLITFISKRALRGAFYIGKKL